MMLVAISAYDAWLELVGRMHPVVVHFPIGLAVVAALVELWRAVRREPGPSEFALTCLWFAAISGVATAASGWFNAAYENDSSGLTLFLHRWLGVAVAVLLLVLAISGSILRRRDAAASAGAWRIGVLVSGLLVGTTGHFGGAMVYGDGYLTDALWNAIDQTERQQRAAAEAEARALLGAPAPGVAQASVVAVSARKAAQPQSIDFATVIVPLLESRCFECHGKGKKKGGVRLDNWEWMTTEHKGEWVVKPFEPDDSLLMKFVMLPDDDEDRMPPEGDPLSDLQIAQLRTWIAEGAFFGDVPSPGAVSDNRWSIPERVLLPEELAQIEATVDAREDAGWRIAPIAIGSSNYEAIGSLAIPPLGDRQVGELAPLASVLVSLNLSRSEITDGCGPAIAKLAQLRALRVDQCRVGDALVQFLKDLPFLESVNFVETELTDAGLAQLEGLKPLRKLFVWSSKVTPEGAERFRAKRPDVSLVTGSN